MPRNSRYLRSKAFAAALVLFIALASVTSMRAYATEAPDTPVISDAAAASDTQTDAPDAADTKTETAGQVIHKHVISNDNPDPMYWHDSDCRQDIDGVAVAPGEPGWPDKFFGDGLDGELRGHHDGRCYKTYIDDPTLLKPEHDPVEPDLDGKPEDGESDIDQSDFEHDGGCIHMDDLVCDDVSPDHEHGDDCYDWGYVDQNGWEHNEDCIKIPYKPGVFDDNDFGMDAEPGDLDTSLLVDPDEIDYLGTGSPERVDAEPAAANCQGLPATGGLGIGMILLTSMSGTVLGFSGYMAAGRKRED